MKNIWRYTGWGLVFLGALHTIVFAIIGAEAISDMITIGIFDSIGLNPERAVAWYGGLWFGVMMILFGFFAQSWIKTTAQALPRYVGWTFAVLGLIGIILQPGSGAPLVLLLSLVIVFVRPAQSNGRV